VEEEGYRGCRSWWECGGAWYLLHWAHRHTTIAIPTL